MLILGLSAHHHGAAAALVRDGEAIAVSREEHFTRRKGDSSLPVRALRFCLREAGIQARDLDRIVLAEKPLRRFERVLVNQLRAFPRSGKPFASGMFQWLGERLWIKSTVADELGVDDDKVIFTSHMQAHAAAAYLTAACDDAAILVADDEGEWATTCLAHGRAGQIEILEEIHFPHSLGLLCGAVAEVLGFESGRGGEGRVAALAAHGRPALAEQLSSVLSLDDDGSFTVDTKHLVFPYDAERCAGSGLVEALGLPPRPGTSLRWKGEDRSDADLAASLQQALEQALLGLVRRLEGRVPATDLCFGGELARNAGAVHRVLRDGPFERLHVPPDPGNGGAALGAALLAHGWLTGERPTRPTPLHLGEPLLEDPIEGATVLDDEALVEALVTDLAEGRVVGWVRGRLPWGDRALGRRALLADARDSQAAEHLRRDIKPREAFRAYDPILPADVAADWLELPEGGRDAARSGRLRVPVKDALASLAPSVVHVDGTAQPVLVDRETDPALHRLLTRFGEQTGVPVLLHTSLNARGDPPVRSESDALAVLDRTALDVLAVEGRLYRR